MHICVLSGINYSHFKSYNMSYAKLEYTWRGKEVNYYVEPEYKSVAKKIFGNTPEMMTFFSKITGMVF